MQNSSYPPAEQPADGVPAAGGPPGGTARPPAATGPHRERMPGGVIFALVVVALHALGTAFSGWAVLEENRNKQDHGQELLMPMGAAWLLALLFWCLAALLAFCVALARKRHAWIRTALTVWTILSLVAIGFLILASLTEGPPGAGMLAPFVVDAVVLWHLLGQDARDWFCGPVPSGGEGGEGP